LLRCPGPPYLLARYHISSANRNEPQLQISEMISAKKLSTKKY
jgi:hypothetical protein